MTFSAELKIFDPCTLEALPPIMSASPDEIESAVQRSADAFGGSWRWDHRLCAQALNRWADVVESDGEGIIDDLVVQTGKLISEARIELTGAVHSLRFNFGLARQPLGRAGSLHDGSEAHLVRDPVGPTVFIVPWNWPILLLLRDLAPGLTAGVTNLIKPGPQTTHVTNRVLGIAEKAGVPSEVLITVVGGADVGPMLVRSTGMRAVAITGSTGVGQAVLRDCAETMTRPVIELGGKSTMMVLPDANASLAFETAANAAVITSGQMCMACTRILMPESMAIRAEQELGELLMKKFPGDPRGAKTKLGPLISAEAMEKVSRYIELARHTARIVTGGDRVRIDGLQGHFVKPALIADVETASPLVQEDIFSPVLTLETYRNEDEGIALANATPFGLASAVWTENLSRGFSLARAMQSGTVWINGYNSSYAEMPSGGVRMSGMGRTCGIAGVEQFTEMKHAHVSFN